MNMKAIQHRIELNNNLFYFIILYTTKSYIHIHYYYYDTYTYTHQEIDSTSV